MFYVFVGNNIQKRATALEKIIKTHEDRELFRVDDLNFDNGNFNNFVSGADLFSKKYLVIFESILETDFAETILGRVNDLESSETIFIFLEKGLDKKTNTLFEKHAKILEDFDNLEKKDERFNIFQITDAFGARDKKSTWILMQRAMRENISAEEILNILIWQVKNLLFVKSAKNVAETGLSPFVYNKSKKYSENFKENELQNISRSLTKLFHESHLGLDLEPNLELFLIKNL